MSMSDGICPKCNRPHVSALRWQKPGKDGRWFKKRIFDKCSGKCRYCKRQIVFGNYGGKGRGKRGHWEVDHGVPFKKCGTDSIRNLWPCCWVCNNEKKDLWDSAPHYERFVAENGNAADDRRKRGMRVN